MSKIVLFVCLCIIAALVYMGFFTMFQDAKQQLALGNNTTSAQQLAAVQEGVTDTQTESMENLSEVNLNNSEAAATRCETPDCIAAVAKTEAETALLQDQHVKNVDERNGTAFGVIMDFLGVETDNQNPLSAIASAFLLGLKCAAAFAALIVIACIIKGASSGS